MNSSFYNNLKKSYLNKEIQVTTVNIFSLEKNSPQPNYVTLQSAFMFPISGKSEIIIDKKIYIAEPGKVIYISQGHHLEFKVLTDEPYEYINIYHSSNNKMIGEFSLNKNSTNIVDNLKKIVSISSNQNINTFFKNKVLLRESLSLIFQESLNIKELEEIKILKQYIDDNFNKKLKLQELADLVYKNKQQVSYLFYKYLNIRPIDYVINKRIEKSILLLKENKMSISKIANSIGYDDPLYFSRLFKKHIGLSPTTFKDKFL